MIFLGIDGGGTRTTAAAADESGKILLKETGGTINFYSVGMEKARSNLRDIAARIEEKLGVTEFESVFIGSSALDGAAGEKLTREFLDGAVRAKRAAMNSDLYIALKACPADGAKLMVIRGTGSMAAAQDERGTISKRGGWGHILGDEGSAYAIALGLLKRAAVEYDNGRNTELTGAVSRRLGFSQFDKIIDFVYSAEASKDRIAALASFVDERAEQGCDICGDILLSQCAELYETVRPLVRQNAPVFLYGGVFEHSRMFFNEFCRRLRVDFPNAEISLLSVPPEEGALKAAMEERR